MINKFCEYLTNKIRMQNSEIDDDKAEIIKYGLQLIFGEIPKLFIMIAIAWGLGILELTILCFILILPYRMYSGGFHLKTHLGCIIGTSLMYTGNAFISKQIVIQNEYKIILSILLWIFSICMIYKYAPADTQDVPVIPKKERRKRKNISYILVTIMLISACLVKDNIIGNILLIGTLIQTICITRIAYKLTNNRYGHEVYWENKNMIIN